MNRKEKEKLFPNLSSFLSGRVIATISITKRRLHNIEELEVEIKCPALHFQIQNIYQYKI